MTTTITLPDHYGYVLLTVIVGTIVIVPTYFADVVVPAGRSKYDIPYPNLYAVPGYHKNADEFNRIQRSHQNMLETLPGFIIMILIGGLKYPIACSIHCMIYNIGCILYQIGYTNMKIDVKNARHSYGGFIKWIGYIGALYCNIILIGNILKWW